MSWTSVEDFRPKSGKKVIGYYKNDLGKGRKIMAYFFEPMTEIVTEDIEDDDDFDWKEDLSEAFYKPGWYEGIENLEDFSFVSAPDMTHWMRLPTSPELTYVRTR